MSLPFAGALINKTRDRPVRRGNPGFPPIGKKKPGLLDSVTITGAVRSVATFTIAVTIAGAVRSVAAFTIAITVAGAERSVAGTDGTIAIAVAAGALGAIRSVGTIAVRTLAARAIAVRAARAVRFVRTFAGRVVRTFPFLDLVAIARRTVFLTTLVLVLVAAGER